MLIDQVSEARWSELSEFVAQRFGLHFPLERWNDLKRGLATAAKEFELDDLEACIQWLLSASPTEAQVNVLASHLTIGETYFFRDNPTLEAVAGNIIPELIRARRGRDQRLHFWSAGCCTGEEPYSLAILLHRVLPDLRDWRVTISGTDINPRFLKKALTGTYSEWSFRNAPPWLKPHYFNRTADGRFAIIPEIKKLVTFSQLNLVDDLYPSLESRTNVDLIFCRNVLMYFVPSQAHKVIRNLHGALAEDGWLAVSPSEASSALFPEYSAVHFPGAILLQKGLRQHPDESTPTAPAVAPKPVLRAVTPIAAPVKKTPVTTAFPEQARAFADQGNLEAALECCDRWIAADKLNPGSHYLRALIQMERGDNTHARASFHRAIYLKPDLVLAHFSLGNLARSLGKMDQADKHFGNALDLLRGYSPSDVLPESDGLTAGRLMETIIGMTEAGSLG